MGDRSWQGSVVPNGGYLYLQIKSEGRWVQRSTGLRDTPENRENAQRKLAEVRSKLHAIEEARAGQIGPLTFQRWGEKWMERRTRKVKDHQHDRRTLELHVFPVIGHLKLDEVRPRHLVDVADLLQTSKPPHAPRTVRNVYSVVKAMFRDAVVADLLRREQDPCVLNHNELGRPRDAKTGWRASAVFSREELTALISDPRIPEDRRLQYAALGLGMVRLGEMSGLRFQKLEAAEPLGRMVLDTTYEDGDLKTERAGTPERWMPIHPTLAGMLAEWRLSGFARAFGRSPLPEDLVLPVTPEPARKGRRKPVGAVRDRHYVWKRAQRDLDALGLRRRRVHDLRRTGISIAQDDGADGRVLRWGTHAAPGEVFDNYTSLHWRTLCREVAKLAVSRPASVRGGPPKPLVSAGDDGT